VKLPLVFHFTQTRNVLKGRVDSPSQNMQNLPADDVALDNGVLTVTFTTIAARFTGVLTADFLAIEGNWTQGGHSLPLRLTRFEGE
jgi:hypothetical protein